ncbi:cyclic nucleotide-binding domain-containing protein [Oscillatoria sp. FACHB-1407]|uniref:SulP family inorganic anion transporter n=1 Tax=Oscillatoria sp. FACHB-1407 TaxID=2692847 RepID=UPI0016892055|nr:SulP family inorganic anion transporter [Oscillatoria sp. FACHB-1407]MBD2462003.1 cyclic nucleotide-binding domain-containing protein [Oscillatoria sp. FACHB-1407]
MIQQKIWHQLTTMNARRLLLNIIAGVVSCIVGSLFSISLVALIFSGELSQYVSIGVGIVLFSAIALRTTVALTSSLPIVIADVDSLPAAIVALSATSIHQSMVGASSEAILITILFTIALATLLSGGILLVLGSLKVGELVRFIPYPVIGGFIAGTGWLLAQGSIQVMTDVALDLANLPTLLQPDRLLYWLPGVGFAIALLLISRRSDRPWVMPAGIFGAVGLFYLALWITQMSIPEARVAGWLLGDFSQENLWQPLHLTQLSQVNWAVLTAQAGNILTIALISPILILLTASSLELVTESDINLNRELQAAGLANLVAGIGGGLVGYQMLVDSMLAYRMGAKDRWVGLISAGLCTFVLLAGGALISYFPKIVLGGLLLFLGLSLLVEWLYDAAAKMPRSDYAVVLLILAVIGFLGFLPGVGVGLMTAIALFIVNYSRTSVTRHVLSGATYRSHVNRPRHQEQLLNQRGEQTLVLELQGFIFFGTANHLLNQIRQRFNDINLEPLRFVVLDFRLVSGLDSSAVISFVKLKQLAHKWSLRLVFTCLHPSIKNMLHQGECLEENDPICLVFADLDRGMEWCEGQILEAVTWRRGRFMPLTLQLQRVFSDPDQVAPFTKYLERSQLATGDWLFHQGQQPEALYFIESGQITTLLERANQTTVRLQTLGVGTTVGEIAFHTQSPYQTSAIADQPTILYSLSVDRLQQMQQNEPEVATVFQEFMIALLATRLNQAYQEIENLLS